MKVSNKITLVPDKPAIGIIDGKVYCLKCGERVDKNDVIKHLHKVKLDGIRIFLACGSSVDNPFSTNFPRAIYKNEVYVLDKCNPDEWKSTYGFNKNTTVEQLIISVESGLYTEIYNSDAEIMLETYPFLLGEK